MEFYVSPDDCKEEITNALNYYCKQYYTSKEIEFFDDYTVGKVTKESQVTKKWDKKFNEKNKIF